MANLTDPEIDAVVAMFWPRFRVTTRMRAIIRSCADMAIKKLLAEEERQEPVASYQLSKPVEVVADCIFEREARSDRLTSKVVWHNKGIPLACMRAAFTTLQSSGNNYTMVFKFPTLNAAQEAHKEWVAFMSAAPIFTTTDVRMLQSVASYMARKDDSPKCAADLRNLADRIEKRLP